MKLKKYSQPQLIDLSLKSVTGACSPFGSLDDTGDCSVGDQASGNWLVSCKQGESPEGIVCSGGINPGWGGNRCRNGSEV